MTSRPTDPQSFARELLQPQTQAKANKPRRIVTVGKAVPTAATVVGVAEMAG